MKKLFVSLSFVLVLCFAFGCQQGEKGAEESGAKAISAEDVAAIKAIGPALDKARLAGDVDGVAALLTDDIVLMGPNGPSSQGRSALIESIKSAESVGVTVKEHITEFIEVDGYGDMAYIRGKWFAAFGIEGFEEPFKNEVKVVGILRKQPDDSWLISRFCWNSDLPLLPSEKEDKGAEITELPQQTFVDTADVEAIKSWYDQKTIITNAGDLDKLKSLFTEDVIFMPPNAILFKGWEAYREFAQSLFDEFNNEEEITYKEIEVFGDLAFVRISYRIQVIPKIGGETALMKGKGMWILKRQTDGSWKGTHCVWNSNYPLVSSEETQ